LEGVEVWKEDLKPEWEYYGIIAHCLRNDAFARAFGKFTRWPVWKSTLESLTENLTNKQETLIVAYSFKEPEHLKIHFFSSSSANAVIENQAPFLLSLIHAAAAVLGQSGDMAPDLKLTITDTLDKFSQMFPFKHAEGAQNPAAEDLKDYDTSKLDVGADPDEPFKFAFPDFKLAEE